MWARSELRARWRAWALLGLLAGATFGVAAAGWAGARRTERAVPAIVEAIRLPTAAVLANDPAFGQRQRAEVERIPGVTETLEFEVAFATGVYQPKGFGEVGGLFPTEPGAMRFFARPLIAGRMPDPRRADEVVVDENLRDRFGLDVGSTMVVGQDAAGAEELPADLVPPGGVTRIRQSMRVVGISKSTSSDASWTPSAGFYRKYGDHMPGVVNQFVRLRGGADAIPKFAGRVAQIVGHPVNVEDIADLYGLRKARNVTDVERDGLLLFALASLIGGGVLVGQALVRAVSASAADLPTWRAMGADRPLALKALLLPALLSAAVGVVTSLAVAVALSSRFPLGTARDYDLDIGTHADWLVLGVTAVALFMAVVAVAGVGAWWRITRSTSQPTRPSAVDRIMAPMSSAPTLMIGARLASEPGRGRRAVPVRSALIGAIAGVVGVVGCLTFRAGIQDAVHEPRRSGVVWDHEVAAGESVIPRSTVTAVTDDHDVDAALDARWERAVPVDGQPVPTFGTRPVKRSMALVLLSGRAPVGPDEIAFAPTTMRQLDVDVGDRVRLGTGTGTTARVVGEALLPVTSHTDYDQSAWMTAAGLTRVAGKPSGNGEEYLLVRWRAGTDVTAARRRLDKIAGPDLFSRPADLPTAVADLARIDDLPLALGAFFALLACATVAHALVTTVRRRRHDLAVLRAVGFTRRQTRGAIAWQSTLLATAGVIVGVPLGVIAGRFAWRWLADGFPIAYAPPLALVAVVGVATLALLIANALAAGPAHVATRIRPAEALRVE
jgi:predicted lysophospholipase L1 biosynthesis ABC-type transport system permease subunit